MMKIQPGIEIKQPVNVQKKESVETVSEKPKADGVDKVDFSAKLKQVKNMESQFTSDSTRQAKLEEVKEQIENGTYAPDLRKVAASLLKFIIKGNRNE